MKLAFGFEILVPKILYKKLEYKTLMKLKPGKSLATQYFASHQFACPGTCSLHHDKTEKYQFISNKKVHSKNITMICL
jgi:hypothetical protein